MQVILNGDPLTLDRSCTISDLLNRLKLTGRLAVEVNEQIVPRSEFEHHTLKDGDRIEIVRAIGGG